MQMQSLNCTLLYIGIWPADMHVFNLGFVYSSEEQHNCSLANTIKLCRWFHRVPNSALTPVVRSNM
jgi:hypothetical protein